MTSREELAKFTDIELENELWYRKVYRQVAPDNRCSNTVEFDGIKLQCVHEEGHEGEHYVYPEMAMTWGPSPGKWPSSEEFQKQVDNLEQLMKSDNKQFDWPE